MACVQVVLVNWIVGVLCHVFRRVLDGSPEIGDVTVEVVDRLVAVEWRRAPEQDRAAAKEWLDESSGSRRSVSTPPLLPFVSLRTTGTALEEPKNS